MSLESTIIEVPQQIKRAENIESQGIKISVIVAFYNLEEDVEIV
jgi:hypothetical protein